MNDKEKDKAVLSIAEENERKKAYLRSYLRSIRREREILDEIQRLRESKMFPAISGMDGMPKGNGNKSDLAEYVAILDEEIEKLKAERLRQARLYRDIEDRIKRMADDNEQRVLRLRYIRGLSWEQVCVEMGYSWKWTHKIHGRALANFKL